VSTATNSYIADSGTQTFSETDLSQFRFAHHKSLVDFHGSVNKWSRDRSVPEYLCVPLSISYGNFTCQFSLHRLLAIHINSATNDAYRRRRHANHEQVSGFYKPEHPQPVTQRAHIAVCVNIGTDNYVWLRVKLLSGHQTTFS
jgi:hypothetical protein